MSDVTDTALKIEAKPQATADVCKFVVSILLLKEGSWYCRSLEEADGLPVLEKLFAEYQIVEALVQVNSITLRKSTDKPWKDLAREVGMILREEFTRSGEILNPQVLVDKIAGRKSYAEGAPLPKLDTENPIVRQIEQVLADSVAPGLAAHGGHVKLVSYADKIAYLRFGGGCQGCSQITVTVKQGIEKILFEQIPEIRSIVDVTEHESGDNPYFH